MEGKQYLCMVELYVEDGKLCINYANNAHCYESERRMLYKLSDFVDKRLREIHEDIMKKIREEIEG